VGSRIAGLEDVIIEDETGLLIKSESPAELAKALVHVRNNSEWTDNAGKAARRRAAAYGWDRIATQHLALYGSFPDREDIPAKL
jgi:glycosyltransferase involved in cell wall biosynthesis